MIKQIQTLFLTFIIHTNVILHPRCTAILLPWKRPLHTVLITCPVARILKILFITDYPQHHAV